MIDEEHCVDSAGRVWKPELVYWDTKYNCWTVRLQPTRKTIKATGSRAAKHLPLKVFEDTHKPYIVCDRCHGDLGNNDVHPTMCNECVTDEARERLEEAKQTK